MKISKLHIASLLLTVSLFASKAQETKILTLEDANNLALQNSRLLKIKDYQVAEKQAKVSEDKVKYLPIAAVNSHYEYATDLVHLTIPQGQFGTLPLTPTGIPLPSKDETFNMTQHNMYGAGATVYQPISQIGKISAGVSVAKRDAEIAQKEASKARMQIKQGVEKLYFGILICQKQKLESETKIAVAEKKMSNVQSAVDAGKMLDNNEMGMMASLADEQQTLLKITIQLDNYKNDFQVLTGLESDDFSLQDVVIEITELGASTVDSTILTQNIDVQIASLLQSKAKSGVKAANYSFVPDFGLIGGYDYQVGNTLYPTSNAFIGASLKWNLTDIASNSYTTRQRKLLQLQANENRLNVEDNTIKESQKVERNIRQSVKLIQVAQKVVEYRTKDLEIQENRQNAGVSLESDLLLAKASLAKAQSDLLSAQLSYRIALSDKKILKGEF